MIYVFQVYFVINITSCLIYWSHCQCALYSARYSTSIRLVGMRHFRATKTSCREYCPWFISHVGTIYFYIGNSHHGTGRCVVTQIRTYPGEAPIQSEQECWWEQYTKYNKMLLRHSSAVKRRYVNKFTFSISQKPQWPFVVNVLTAL